jgi:hypothetical protein
MRQAAGSDNIGTDHNNVANCDNGVDGGVSTGWMHVHIYLAVMCFYRGHVHGRRHGY